MVVFGGRLDFSIFFCYRFPPLFEKQRARSKGQTAKKKTANTINASSEALRPKLIHFTITRES